MRIIINFVILCPQFIYMLKTMKHLTLLFFCLMAWSHVNAQVSITYNNEAQWKTYDDFNAVFLDSDEFIYKADTKQA